MNVAVSHVISSVYIVQRAATVLFICDVVSIPAFNSRAFWDLCTVVTIPIRLSCANIVPNFSIRFPMFSFFGSNYLVYDVISTNNLEAEQLDAKRLSIISSICKCCSIYVKDTHSALSPRAARNKADNLFFIFQLQSLTIESKNIFRWKWFLLLVAKDCSHEITFH